MPMLVSCPSSASIPPRVHPWWHWGTKSQTQEEELWEIGRKGIKLSMRSQIMVERRFC